MQKSEKTDCEKSDFCVLLLCSYSLKYAFINVFKSLKSVVQQKRSSQVVTHREAVLEMLGQYLKGKICRQSNDSIFIHRREKTVSCYFDLSNNNDDNNLTNVGK